LLAATAFTAATALPSAADACGASAGGASGVSACSLEEHLEAARAKWRLGASYAFTSTALRFDDTSRFDESRHVAFATAGYRLTPAWTFEVALGSIVGGRLESGSTGHEFNPGFLAATGASFRLLEAQGVRPFVALTAQVAWVLASTHASGTEPSASTRYQALDGRAGAVAGWTLGPTLVAYALARAFGGPVWWSPSGARQLGTDVHHFQLGAGLLARVARQVDLFAEGVPLGEQGISAGGGFFF
jgi:hypothetical protein